MADFCIYYQHPKRVSATEIVVRATSAQEAREGFEREHPHLEVLCVYPREADPALIASMHHSAEYWEAETGYGPIEVYDDGPDEPGGNLAHVEVRPPPDEIPY